MDTITSGKLAHIAKDVKIKVVGGATLDWSKQDKWQQNANGYRVTLSYQGRRMSLDFWQGTGIKNKPTATGVLECILSNAQASEEHFEEFCASYGYDQDSRKAEKIWRFCIKTKERLKKLLGADYNRFMIAERE